MIAVTQTFKPEAHEVGHARRFVVSTLAEADLPSEQAELIASELATNAVVHARTGFRMNVDHDIDSVRIAVFDDGGGWPCRRPPAGDSESGRGLRIVDHIAQRWGVIWSDPGKTVWAELSVPAALSVLA